jgi:acetylxylan esterase
MKYHLNYFDKWGTEAADWVVERARNASGIPAPGDTSGASKILKHPIANVFLAIIILFAL